MVFGSCPFTKSGNSQGLSWVFYPQLLFHFTKHFSICECQRLLALLFSRKYYRGCCIPTIIDEYPVSYSYMMVRRCPWSWSHTTFNALQSRDRWDHRNPPHQLHDDTKHVYTVILQRLGDDARNIIAIWNDWECWQPNWLLKSDHSKWPPNPGQLAFSCWDHSMSHSFWLGSNNANLGGGFKHVLFSPLFGEMIQSD